MERHREGKIPRGRVGGSGPEGALGEQLKNVFASAALMRRRDSSLTLTADNDGDNRSGTRVHLHLVVTSFGVDHVHGPDWGIVSLFQNCGQHSPAPNRRQSILLCGRLADVLARRDRRQWLGNDLQDCAGKVAKSPLVTHVAGRSGELATKGLAKPRSRVFRCFLNKMEELFEIFDARAEKSVERQDDPVRTGRIGIGTREACANGEVMKIGVADCAGRSGG